MDNLNYPSDELAELYRLLGDKTRLIMAEKLSTNHWTVSEFVQLFDISQPLVSQHIRKLKDASLVSEQRMGKRILYSLDPQSPHYELVLMLLRPLKEEQTKQSSASQ